MYPVQQCLSAARSRSLRSVFMTCSSLGGGYLDLGLFLSASMFASISSMIRSSSSGLPQRLQSIQPTSISPSTRQRDSTCPLWLPNQLETSLVLTLGGLKASAGSSNFPADNISAGPLKRLGFQGIYIPCRVHVARAVLRGCPFFLPRTEPRLRSGWSVGGNFESQPRTPAPTWGLE